MLNGVTTTKWLAGVGRVSALTLLLTGQTACADEQQTLPQLSIHDPVMAQQDGRFYLFSTGPGITYYHSDDMLQWQLAGRVFADEPQWAKQVAPSFDGHIWAPDIYQRSEKAIDWKTKGLKKPVDQAQWVQINDQYVMVMITNGTIVEMKPVER